MTARLSFSYNREVYALPGRIDDPRSQGCNLLIKEKIAEAIDSVEGLLSGMGMNAVKSVREISDKDMIASYFSGNGTDSSTMMELTVVFGMIRKNRGINLDDLSAKTGFSYSRIARLAGMLEMEDLISMDLLQRCTVNMRKSR